MEKMPYRDDLSMVVAALEDDDRQLGQSWQRALPVIEGRAVTLRELRPSDARSLFARLSTEEVSRFISPPPTTVSGFERFIAWTHRQREAGDYICYGIVPRGMDVAVGLIQVRRLDPEFSTAEWGFALGSQFWGTGLFIEAAHLVVDFVFDVLRAHRLEARAALRNGRGNGVLRKLGAVQEGILRRSLLRNGEHLDQALWTILAADWHAIQTPCSAVVH